MEHSEHRGHRISTEARPIGERWRGYYSVDRGSYVATVPVCQTEQGAHLEARHAAVAAINKMPGAQKAV